MSKPMSERVRAEVMRRLAAETAGLCDAVRGELSEDGAEARFWFRVTGPPDAPALIARLRACTAEARAAYPGTRLSAALYTPLLDGVILWAAYEDAELAPDAPPPPPPGLPEIYAATAFGPAAELWPIEVPAVPAA